ncbi:MAG TPA: hypothetical protein VKA46_16380 [Gemmataceae bacterium]|nr:hypothetical protein [Gemmataceae bacterium]
MLAEIAEADYGHDADAHLAGLRPIRDQGIVPAPTHWHPAEVLELIRWSNPEDANWKPGSTGVRGHRMRAFACAALLRAAAESTNEEHVRDDDATLAKCLASAKVLGEEMSEAAARFLTWRIPRMAREVELLLYGVGLLVVATRLRVGRIEDRVLGDTAEWLLAEEASFRQAVPSELLGPEEACLFGPSFGLLQGFWHPLAAELIREAAAIGSGDVRDLLEFVAALVLDARGW